MTKRDAILRATKELLWERGYEATSPRDIQDRSAAGQGSFYHHFRSKRDLAAEAIGELAAERLERLEEALSASGTLKQRLHRFLDQKRDALKGCPVGRMVWDAAIEDTRLRRPLEQYFRQAERRLREELDKAVEAGEVELRVPAPQLALAMLAVMQGGYTISRAFQEPRLAEATRALRQLIDLAIVEA
jgi:AcrR family transcriptional regulator